MNKIDYSLPEYALIEAQTMDSSFNHRYIILDVKSINIIEVIDKLNPKTVGSDLTVFEHLQDMN